MRDEELERSVRSAFDRLPHPSDTVTAEAKERAMSAVGGGHAQPSSRRIGRGLGAVAVALMVFAGAAGFALGRTSSSDQTRTVRTQLTATGGPGFVPARGWNTLQTDGASINPGGTATAATIPIRDQPMAFPHQTIAALSPGDVLIQARLYGRADFIRPGWSTYPPRRLPLRTPHGDAAASWEGGSGWRYVITGRVDGWLLEVSIYFGAQPSAEVRRLADQELARLLLPSPCPDAEAIAPAQVGPAAAAVKRVVPRAIDTSVTPPVDYRDPRVRARRATAADAVPRECRHIPRDRIVVVDVRYPFLAARPKLAHRTYLVSRQDNQTVVWARTR